MEEFGWYSNLSFLLVFIIILIIRCCVTVRSEIYRITHYSTFVHIKHNIYIMIMIVRLIFTTVLYVPILALSNQYELFYDTPYWTTVFLIGGSDIVSIIIALDLCIVKDRVINEIMMTYDLPIRRECLDLQNLQTDFSMIES